MMQSIGLGQDNVWLCTSS